MGIKEIENKDIWEDFLLNCEEKTFLQSWNWGEFQKMMGNKIWRLGIYSNGELFSVCLVALIKAKRGRFLLIQHGPSVVLTRNDKSSTLEALLGRLREIAKDEKASFIRIAPLLERNEENIKIFKDLGFKESPMHANAYTSTWKLDLMPSEDELLMNMRKTTRYLIRQAMKNQDITIASRTLDISGDAPVMEKSTNLNDIAGDKTARYTGLPATIELYQKLSAKAAKRQDFVPFSFEYIKNEFEIFSKDNQTLLFLGKYKGEIAAAALVIFWQGISFYHQAASDAKFAKFSIPYLLQWEAIKEAKKRGCILYDFWGFVDPEKNPKHPWAGPTLFKMGFGGYKKEYIKTQDFPLSNRYWLIFAFEKLRKAKRSL